MDGVLVGRRGELDRLVDFLGALQEGLPGVALVAGEAGIGKTRVVREVSDRLEASGVHVLTGCCLDLQDARLPYSPLADALRTAPGGQVADALDAVTGRVEVPRPQLFELLRASVCQLAARQRTVVVIEDLHWADAATVDALLFLLASATCGRWALLGTYRDDEVAGREGLRDLLVQLARHRAERVVLGRLAPDEVAQQVGALTGTRPDARSGAHLHRRSDGIPLLVEELVAAEAAGIFGVPTHLRELHLARIAAMSDGAADLVRLAAVAGPTVEVNVLAAAAGRSLGDVADGLDEAVAAGCLVVDSDTCGFHHELLREAVSGSLTPMRRRILHGSIAEALAATSSPNVAALARHWHEAGQLPQAAMAAWQAAAEAERLHAPAHTHLEQILELWEHLPPELNGPAHRLAMVARTAEACYLAGLLARAISLAEEAVARSTNDPVQHATRLERLARYRWGRGDGVASEAAYRQAVAVLPDDVSPAIHVRVLAGYAWILAATGRPEARDLLERAQAIVSETGDPLQRCRGLLAAAWLSDDGPTLAAEARDVARALDADDELGLAHVALFHATTRQGRTRDALEAARAGAAMARAGRTGHLYRVLMDGCVVEALMDLGEWDEAGQLLEGDLGHEVRGLAGAYAVMHGIRLAVARGDGDTVRTVTEQVLAVCERVPQQPVPLLVTQWARAHDLLWSGRPGDALDLVTDTLARVPPHAIVAAPEAALVSTGMWAAADLAEQARLAGDPSALTPITVVADGLGTRLAGSPDPRVRAQALTVVAERSRLDTVRDAAAWQAVADAWDELEDPYQGACARWRLGQVLVATRSGRAAREALSRAWEVAADLGARPLRGAVEDTARRAGLSLGAAELEPDPAGKAARRLGLTAREREILGLLARGRTNRQIADLLFISHRTVGVHVSRILRKLGAANRTDASHVARRNGLLSD